MVIMPKFDKYDTAQGKSLPNYRFDKEVSGNKELLSSRVEEVIPNEQPLIQIR
jgi:hypothetical protein